MNDTITQLATVGAYDLRIYDVLEGEMETLLQVLAELALPTMPEFGIEPVGFWTEETTDRLFQISSHSRLEDVQSNWDSFHADPRWQEGLARIRQDRVIVKKVETVLLRGLDGLPSAGGYL